MMKKLLLAMTILVATAGLAQADLVYGFRFSPTTTLVLPGLQTIDIFLDQTATAPDSANLHTVGLGTAIFTVNSSDPTISFTGTTGFVDGAEGGLVGASLDVSNLGTAVFLQGSLLNPGTVASGTLATSGSATFSTIRIGTVSFNLAAGQTTTLSSAPFTSGDFGLADGTVISSIAAASLTITAIPEPSSLALVGLVGFGLAGWRRRK